MWEYLTLPDALRLPACPECGNRGQVTMVAAGVFVCADGYPAHVFRARWVKQAERPVVLDAVTELERTA